MYKLVELMEKHVDELSAIESIDAGMCSGTHLSFLVLILPTNQGKQFMAAKMFDITMAINNMRYFAGWADKNSGQMFEAGVLSFNSNRYDSVYSLLRREPCLF